MKTAKQYDPIRDKQVIIQTPEIRVESSLSNYNLQYNRLLSHQGVFNKKIGYFSYHNRHKNILMYQLRNNASFIEKE